MTAARKAAVSRFLRHRSRPPHAAPRAFTKLELTSRSAPLTLDVDTRAVGVYVYAKTRGRGSLDVLGLRR